MDELLNAIYQRKCKINEVQDSITTLRNKYIITQSERSNIYAFIRKLKEDEKNRTEKENWIVSIMRNTKCYNEEQMGHIFIKTIEIMKIIHQNFVEVVYTPTLSIQHFLDIYYNLFINFYSQFNSDSQLKVQFRKSVKQGNINLVTDLLKSLLVSSRKQLRDVMEDLAYSVNRDVSPDKGRLIKKPATDLLENLRTRSTTQTGAARKDNLQTMANSVIILDEKEKKEMTKECRLKPQKRIIVTQQKIQSFEYSPSDSPLNNLKQKLVNLQQKDAEKPQFTSIYSHITPVVDDLDDQNLAVMDYQSIKRQSQGFDEFKQNYESLLDKIKNRNSYVQQSVTDYNAYTYKNQQTTQAEFIKQLKDKYQELTDDDDSQFHFCMKRIKPAFDDSCKCTQLSPQSCHQQSTLSSPIKGKILIRKSVQNIKKSITSKSNSFTAKNLIDQLKKQNVFNSTILCEDRNALERTAHQNSPTNKQNSKRQDLYGPINQYRLYVQRLSNDSNKPQARAQSANGKHHMKYLTCSGYLENANLYPQSQQQECRINTQQQYQQQLLILTKSAA